MTIRPLFLALVAFGACVATPDTDETSTETSEVRFDPRAEVGRLLFDHALPHTNGRSCATCHVAADHFLLTAEHVAATPPGDPLFARLDADDPDAAVPTYNHLGAGLVRITLPLADNLDVIDGAGNVVTNADRTIWVWRGVPTIENVDVTAPYQLDGRAPTLTAQALGALRAHSQIAHDPPAAVLADIAAFERTVHSRPSYPHPRRGSDAAAGAVLFEQICARCHGGAATNVIREQAVFDSFFPVQNPDGTIQIAGFLPTGVAIPAAFMTNVPRHPGLNYGIAGLGMLAQIGVLPNPSGLDAPHYRIRFYTDATRTVPRVDMPPLPPGIGPTLAPEPFSIDPGHAIISGDPIDWEGFDIPQLRGIANTAPYFHDNSAPDLATLLDIYSRFVLPTDPVLSLPPVFAPEGPGLPPESLSPAQKTQLLAFLVLL
jgi:cytochrome c peroxidase